MSSYSMVLTCWSALWRQVGFEIVETRDMVVHEIKGGKPWYVITVTGMPCCQVASIVRLSCDSLQYVC